MKRLILLSLALITLPLLIHAQTIRRVNPSSSCTSGCSGADFGTTNAYKYLQDAIDASVSGDEVWVMEGTHYPTKDQTGNASPIDPRDKTFKLKDGVEIYGGWANTTTGASSFGARDAENEVTVLSGDLGTGSVQTDNAYHVVYSINTSTTTIVDGFTIQDGFIDQTLPSGEQGGAGIYNYSGDLILSNCIVKGNEDQMYYQGTGMYNASSSSPEITDCVFDDNSGNSNSGVGIYADGGSLEISGSTFKNHQTLNGGGSVWVINGCTLTIDDCVFDNNETGDGGCGVTISASTGEITNTSFTDNFGGAWGSAISIVNVSTVDIETCTFAGNVAKQKGGAIYIDYNCTVTLDDCSFTGNEATNTSSSYGTNGGAIFMTDGGSMDISNCDFTENLATSGDNSSSGAIGLDNSPTVTITDCNFTDNEASSSEGFGGAIGSGEVNLEVFGCVFEGNSAYAGGAFYNSDPTSIKFDGCVFISNSAAGGGAICEYGNGTGSLEILNSLFVNNEALFFEGGYGGGIYINDYELDLVNVTAYNNEADYGGFVSMESCTAIVVNNIIDANTGNVSDDDFHQVTSSMSVDYSMTQNTYAGTGNVVSGTAGFLAITDPDGADDEWFTTDDGFRITNASDGLDVGDNSVTTTYSFSTDILGAARNQNSTVDMGAYEGSAAVCGVGTIVYVDANVSSPGNGGCWDEAFDDLEAALTAIEGGGSYELVETIKVKQGSYSPGSSAASTFNVIAGVDMYGGYPTAATLANDESLRDPSSYTTTLNGYYGTGYNNNILKATNINSTSKAVVIDGFSITKGKYNLTSTGGGGMLITGSDYLTVLNCRITNNSTQQTDGGGVYLSTSNCRFENCVIANNYADQYGGGVSCNNSLPSFTNCVFSGNDADERGGALALDNASHVNLTDCEFSSNASAEYGGAIYMDDGCSGVFLTCEFYDNSTGLGDGGAIHMRTNCRPLINECRFEANSSADGGGAIHMYNNCYPTITNTVFVDNEAADDGGALYLTTDCEPEIVGCVFYNNDADDGKGGAIYSTSDCRFTLEHSTIYGNTAKEEGGACFMKSGSKLLSYGNIFWDNSSVNVTAPDDEIYADPSGTAGDYLLRWCIAENAASYGGTTNSSTNPSFASTTYIDVDELFTSTGTFLRLSTGSTFAINGGNNAYCPSMITTDVSDNVRVSMGKIDIGAFESTYGTQWEKYPTGVALEDIQLFQGCEELSIPTQYDASLEDFWVPLGLDPANDNMAAAFAYATQWILDNDDPTSSSHRIRLRIPEGDYEVGLQLASGTPDIYTSMNFNIGGTNYNVDPTAENTTSQNLLGMHTFDLSGAHNVTIEGEGDVNIYNEKDLYYGGWNSSLTATAPQDASTMTNPGAMFRIVDCNCVAIKNMDIDGSFDEAQLGASQGGTMTGAIVSYDGFVVNASSNILIEDVTQHHTGRDGIMTLNTAGATEDVFMYNSKFEWNARQAFSWSGGDLMRAINCDFAHTGQGSFVNGHGGGIDVELVIGPAVTQGFFKDCRIYDNYKASYGDSESAPYWTVGDVEFDNCMFWSQNDGSNWFTFYLRRLRNHRFYNCQIYGAINDFSGSGPMDQLVFEECLFSDLGPDGQQAFYLNDGHPTLIYASDGASLHPKTTHEMYYRFTNCTVETHALRIAWLSVTSAGQYFNDWECNTFNMYTDELISNGLLECYGGNSYANSINDLGNSRFYSNVFYDRNPVSTVPSLGCTNRIYFELYSLEYGNGGYGGLNITDGQNLILPNNSITQMESRVWRQINAANYTWSMQKSQF